jgi:hypothetical protein
VSSQPKKNNRGFFDNCSCEVTGKTSAFYLQRAVTTTKERLANLCEISSPLLPSLSIGFFFTFVILLRQFKINNIILHWKFQMRFVGIGIKQYIPECIYFVGVSKVLWMEAKSD